MPVLNRDDHLEDVAQHRRRRRHRVDLDDPVRRVVVEHRLVFLLIDFPPLADDRFVGIVDDYYEPVDRLLGQVVESAGLETTVLVVSDHGWSYGGPYGHYHGPNGVFVLSGAEALAGELAVAPDVRDVAPTVLALLGLPASSEMTGRVVEAALSQAVRAKIPRAPIKSWGAHRPQWSGVDSGTGMRRESLDRLRELGYVQ